MCRVLLLAVPSKIRPALGQRRVRRQNISIIACIRSGAIQIAQPKDIAVAFLGIRAVDGLLTEDHCSKNVSIDLTTDEMTRCTYYAMNTP